MPVPDFEPYKVVTSETSSATKFDNLVQAIEDEFGDIDPDQISGYPSDVTKFLSGAGTWIAPTASSGLSVIGTPTTTAADVVSSASELSLRLASAAGNSTGWLIPAGTIGTTKLITLKAHGDYLYNVGGATIRFRVYLRDGAGANTLLFDDTSAAANVSANRNPWKLEIDLAALNSASSQLMTGTLAMPEPPGGAPTSGIGTTEFGAAGATRPITFADDAASAVDMATDKYLDVTVTWSASNAALSWRLKYATMTVTG